MTAVEGVASVPPPPQEAEKSTSMHNVESRTAKLTHCSCRVWVRILEQLSMKVLRSCVDKIIGRTSLSQFAEVAGGIALARQLPPWGRTVKAMDAYECEYNTVIYLHAIES